MSGNQSNWLVLSTTMLITGALVLTILEMNGTNEATAILTLRLTAYISFLIFFLLFVARPLQQLVDSRLTQTLKRNRRYFGITLAGSHTVHLILIIVFVLGTGVPFGTLLIGGVAYALLYLLLTASFDGPAAAIGPVARRRIHLAALYWIGGTFTFTLSNNFIANPDGVVRRLAVILILLAIGIRVAAFLKNRGD